MCRNVGDVPTFANSSAEVEHVLRSCWCKQKSYLFNNCMWELKMVDTLKLLQYGTFDRSIFSSHTAAPQILFSRVDLQLKLMHIYCRETKFL